MIPRRLPLPLLLFLFVAGGCAPEGEDPARGPTLTPERIVSLVPSATAILRELGLESRLVGRTDFDLDPELRHLPSVGGGLGPSMEQLVQLRPDLVIRFEGDSDAATGARLDAAGIAHFGIRPDRIEDVRRIIYRLGAVTGRGGEATALVRRIDGELEEIRALLDGAPRPRAILLLGGDPPLVAGGGTFLHELLEIAGGENVFAELGELYVPVSLEEIVRRDVEIIVASEGARLPAALRGIRVVRVPGEVQIPGPALGRSARLLARELHPDRVP